MTESKPLTAIEFKKARAVLKAVKQRCSNPNSELTDDEKFKLRHEAGMELLEAAKAELKSIREQDEGS